MATDHVRKKRHESRQLPVFARFFEGFGLKGNWYRLCIGWYEEAYPNSYQRDSLISKTAKNYYEILELSANANQDTIERMFRYLATKHHPDSGGDKEKFSFLVKAFENLRDPVSRATYDAQLQQQDRENAGLAEHAKQIRSRYSRSP